MPCACPVLRDRGEGECLRERGSEIRERKAKFSPLKGQKAKFSPVYESEGAKLGSEIQPFCPLQNTGHGDGVQRGAEREKEPGSGVSEPTNEPTNYELFSSSHGWACGVNTLGIPLLAIPLTLPFIM
jgi:hypothetical protein